jgi:stage II sporulation protein D
MFSRTTRIVTAILASAVVLVPTAPADAAASDPLVTIPTGTTTLTVAGDGWGHGHGMSQWGAQGAALQGLSHAAILAFYYPGTKLSSLSARVRVLITEDTDNNTTVQHTTGMRVVDLGNGKAYRLRTTHTPKAWRLKTRHGQTRVYYRTAKWHLYRTGGRAALKGAGEFRSSTGRLTLKMHSGNRTYRGALRFVNNDTVNVVSLEKYLRGVVPSEAFPSWHPNALRAQAVAARTYAAFERADNVGGYYQICDTSACQVYRGYDVETSTTDAAIAATAGQVLLYAGKLAFTQFSASSGGWTSTGSQPYLIAQPDVYDTAASKDPNLNWTRKVDIATLQKAYPDLGTLTSIQITDRDGDASHPNDGWVQSIVLKGTKNGLPTQRTISGGTFKSLYGLKSAYFTLTAP